MKASEGVTSENIELWLEDIIDNPVVWPESLKSLSSLVYDLSTAMGAIDSGIQCDVCAILQKLGLTKDMLRARSYAIEEAMTDLFLEVVSAEKEECTLVCGTCNSPANPETCSCPELSKQDCSTGSRDELEVWIKSIIVKEKNNEDIGSGNSDLAVRITGLQGHDGTFEGPQDTNPFEFTIDKTMTVNGDEFFYLDLIETKTDGSALDPSDKCMGATKVYFKTIGVQATYETATQECTGNNPKRWDEYTGQYLINGCYSKPNSCVLEERNQVCTLVDSEIMATLSAAQRQASASTAAIILMLAAVVVAAMNRSPV